MGFFSKKNTRISIRNWPVHLWICSIHHRRLCLCCMMRSSVIIFTDFLQGDRAAARMSGASLSGLRIRICEHDRLLRTWICVQRHKWANFHRTFLFNPFEYIAFTITLCQRTFLRVIEGRMLIINNPFQSRVVQSEWDMFTEERTTKSTQHASKTMTTIRTVAGKSP